jgi:hypothetical protein
MEDDAATRYKIPFTKSYTRAGTAQIILQASDSGGRQ